MFVASNRLGQEEPQKPLPKERSTFLTILLGARLSKGLPLLDWPQVAQGTEAVPRRAAHPLLSCEGAFWVCITTFEGFPQVLAAPCVCFLSFQPPVSLGMYRSLYKRDYRWCKEYKPLNEEDVQVPWAFPCLDL